MKKLFVFFLLIGALSTKAQFKYVTHDEHLWEQHAGFPFWDGSKVWWNDSIVSYFGGYNAQDTVRNLLLQVGFLMRDDLETHRRLDSLVSAMKKPK